MRTLKEPKPSRPPASDGPHGRSQNRPAGKQRHSSTLKEAVLQDGRPSSSQEAPSATPAKPIQVYAGPTFHASPAPSSLPMPKMFSKSVPQVNDKTVSLKAMMEEEDVSDDSSFGGDGSPSMRNAGRAGNDRTRDVSPLDIFFKADRQQRAQRGGGAAPSDSLQTPPPNRRTQSSSPVTSHAGPPAPPPQPHEPAMFALESDTDGPGARPASHRAPPPPPRHR